MIKKLSILRSESGYTLVELTTVMIISTFLILTAAIAFSVFFAKFREVSRWIELQKDAFECMQTIKDGVSVGSGSNQQFFGVANANKLELSYSGFGGNKLIAFPPAETIANTNDRIEFYSDRNFVRAYYAYGTGESKNVRIFPDPKKTEYMKLTNFEIVPLHYYGQKLVVVNVRLSARVQTAKDKFRYVNYSTNMAIKRKTQ